MKFKKCITSYIHALIASSCVMLAFPSMADYTHTQMEWEIVNGDYLNTSTKNDCGTNKFFSTGTGFSDCEVFYRDTNGNITYLQGVTGDPDDFNTDAIAKYEDGSWKEGGLNITMTGNKTGSWSANGQPLPDIRFWTAKSSTGFKLFWMVDLTTAGNACDTVFSVACLNLAHTTDSGSWTTPGNKGLSHLTFFGGPSTSSGCAPNCPVTVPEPKTIMIFALGLLALVVRKKHLTPFKS